MYLKWGEGNFESCSLVFSRHSQFSFQGIAVTWQENKIKIRSWRQSIITHHVKLHRCQMCFPVSSEPFDCVQEPQLTGQSCSESQPWVIGIESIPAMFDPSLGTSGSFCRIATWNLWLVHLNVVIQRWRGMMASSSNSHVFRSREIPASAIDWAGPPVTLCLVCVCAWACFI